MRHRHHVPSPQMNKFLEEADLHVGLHLAMATPQDTCSVDKLIKRLSYFKITPKSSSNCFC